VPRSISAPVGQGAPNIFTDVLTIQELINQVPVSEGGLPDDKKLAVDGICGPKTKDAISKFQLKQFGWKGADGKVEPGKQTLAKLNSFEKPTPPPPPPKPPVVSRQFVLQFVNKGNIIGLFRKDRFLLVTLVPTQEQAIYWLGTGGPPAPTPNKFEGVGSLMKTALEHSVDQLGGVGFYSSKSDGKTVQSQMVMTISGETVRTRMNAHLVEPESNASTMFGAELILVQSGVQIF
jgi:hypothetical protein